jgi:squalene-associated FAD-dependent desaturase
MSSSERGSVHIIGAGLAGLAAAVRLAPSGRAIVVHEATQQAGGRCRSYPDQATGLVLDNGMHLVLSGNHAVLSYTRTIGSEGGLQGPADAEFPFVDLSNDARWTLRLNDGVFPWWVFDKGRRVPQTGVIDYLPLARLLWASADKPLGETMNCSGPLYERLIAPLMLAALNIEPREGSAKLAAALMRETLGLGGKACRPLIARAGLGKVFVDPALRYLHEHGASILLEDQLVKLHFSGQRVSRLEFTDRTVDLADGDAVILTVPPYVASALLPDLRVPTAFRGIVNAHFRVTPPPQSPPMIGVINGTCQWIFSLPDRISVTISDAGHLFETPRAELAEKIWREAASVTGLSGALPPWQIVRERRATFAATPEQNGLRPGAQTQWENLLLAGDWTATGLAATLESAVRSGHRAAELIANGLRAAA